jgi:hypothetical protein
VESPPEIVASSGRGRYWMRKPVALIMFGAVAGALTMLLLTKVGVMVMNAGLARGIITWDEGQNDDGQVSERIRIRDLEHQLTGKQQGREALGGDKEKAFPQVTSLKSEKQQALSGKQSGQKELDRALARIKTAETERDQAKEQRKETNARLREKESILKVRFEEENRIANRVRADAEIERPADSGNTEPQYLVGKHYFSQKR